MIPTAHDRSYMPPRVHTRQDGPVTIIHIDGGDYEVVTGHSSSHKPQRDRPPDRGPAVPRAAGRRDRDAARMRLGRYRRVRRRRRGVQHAFRDGLLDGRLQVARAALATETYVKPSRAKVSDFFEAWFPYVRTTTEPTTAANYEVLARAYVLPWIGRRPIQEIVPSVVAALYSHLLAEGRRRRDTNWEMFRVWQDARAAKREIRPHEIADKVGVTHAAARKAVQRYKAGRIPSTPDPGLSPKTVKTVHIVLSSAMATALRGKYLSVNPTEGVKPPSAARRTHSTWNPKEREAFGGAYQDHGLVFCWEDGRPIYPDTITERFNRLVELARLPLIRLHDVRHSYATIALRSGVYTRRS